MPSSAKKTLKDLHLASSLGDLNKLADPGLPVDRNANPATYIKSADKVYLKAESHDLEGDEENAYVFYMRFFNIISLIKKSNKYTEKKKYYDDLMGKSKTLKSIDRAEALQKSLDKRYERLKSQKEAKAKAEEEAKRKEEEDKKALMSKKAQNNGVDSDDNDLDSLLNGVGISSSADVYQKLKVSHGSILMPKTSENTDGTLISGLESPSFSSKPDSKPCVSAQDLYNLLTGENVSKVLVLDCRPHSMFLQNRINRPSCINIPAELLDQGVSAGSIERRLHEDTRRIWKKRGEKEFVILMDESTKAADITPECQIQRLKDVIFTFDSYSSLKTEPLFLDGGFHSWLWHYPSLALKPELPKVLSQTKAVTPVDLSSLDYPELPEERTSPPEPQLPPSSEPGPNKGNIQYPVIPPAGLENVLRPFVNSTGGIKQGNMELPPSHEPAPGPGPKFEKPTINPSVPQSHAGVPFTRTSDIRPSFPPNVPLSQPGTLSLQPSNPPFLASGPQSSLGVAPQSIIPNQLSPGKPVAAPSATVPHPSNQSISEAGVPSSGSPAVPIAQPSSIPSAAVPKPFSVTNVPFPDPSSMPSAHTGIPSTQPPTSRSTPPAHMASSGSDRSRQMLSNSGQSVSPVPQTQPVSINSTSSGASQASSVAPAPVTSSTVSPSSATSHSQGPRVGTSSSPGQMPQQVSQTAQPGHQTQVSSVSQVSHDERQVPGQTSHSATSPHQAASKSIPSADPRNNQHGRQAPSSNTQVPPYSNVSGTTQHSPQKPTQMPGNTQVTHPVKPEPQQPLSKKPSSYATTPGLPPGWERIENGGRPYYKDHNTQTTHWEPPKVPTTGTTGTTVAAPQSSVPKQQQPQIKRQSSVDRPSLRRSLSSPNLAKLSDEGSAGPKKPVIDRLSKPDSVQTVPARPVVNRVAKPLSANQLDSFNPSHGGFGPALTGLRNLGNTCYMNSVVQCLSSVAPLAAFFISGTYREDINRSNRDGTRGELAENFSVLIRILHSGQFKCVSPGEFKRTIGKFKSQFSGYDQQDSQELLAFLMDGLQEDLNKVKQKPYTKAPDDDLDPETAANTAWENHKKRNKSIMVELFDGLFMSTVKCMVCGKESRTFDTFSNLTLPLPSNASRCSLQDCLNLFTKPEKMAGDDKWFCPKCKQRREASKTIQIWRLPAILVVHLKRFQYEGMWRQKLQTSVSFPMLPLDMSSYVVGPKSTGRYNLHAVSNHYGTMHGGHYTAFTKSVYDKKWYKFDDQYVTEMSQKDVVTSAGYLLFYTSFDFKPPKCLFKS